MRVLKDFDFKNKRVLVRADFNVPLNEKGLISDDFRIKKSLPTIEYLIEKKAKVILISHLGRPGNKDLKYSLKPIASRLGELLKKKVRFLDDCIGKKVEKEIKKMKSGEIILLENLRFYKEEKKNDENFAKELSELADIYINDAFGASHRAHASIIGVPKYLPSGAGFLLEKEVSCLAKLSTKPEKPLVAVIGGAKAETKVKLIDKISEVADFILIGGLVKKAIMGEFIQLKEPQKVIEPVDEALEGKDIGPKTIELFKEKILEAKTILWNGPLGKIEEEEFAKGSKKIAYAIIKSRAYSVVGGGETVEFINKLGLIEKFDHVSTGGGAMLAFLSGEKLPGLEALK